MKFHSGHIAVNTSTRGETYVVGPPFRQSFPSWSQGQGPVNLASRRATRQPPHAQIHAGEDVVYGAVPWIHNPRYATREACDWENATMNLIGLKRADLAQVLRPTMPSAWRTDGSSTGPETCSGSGDSMDDSTAGIGTQRRAHRPRSSPRCEPASADLQG